MNQEAYMKLLTRQADKEIEALHNELADINKNLHNMTNIILDPDSENFAEHVEGSIEYYKQKKIDLEEGIKIQKDLKQGYQTVITTLTKQKSMSNETSMKTTHETQRSVLETIMEDSDSTTMSVDITNTSIATTSIAAAISSTTILAASTSTNTAATATSTKARTGNDATASTINMNITPDGLIGNVANITTTDVIKNVTARSGEMTNDEDKTILEHLSTPRTAPLEDSEGQNSTSATNFKGVPLNNYRQFVIKMYLLK